MSRFFESNIDAIQTDPVDQPVRYGFRSTSKATEIPGLVQFSMDLANVGRGNITPDLLGRAGTAIKEPFSYGPTGRLVRNWLTKDLPDDPSFVLTEDRLAPLLPEVPKDLWHRYADARSDEQLQAIHEATLAELGSRRRLAQSGWMAVPGTILAEILDPQVLAASVLSGGAGEAVGIASTAGRLAMLGRAGLYAGVPLAGQKAIQATYDDTVGAADIASAGLSGFGFGVGSALTARSGAITHGLAAGFGGAVPTLGVDALRQDADSRDALIGFTTGFLTGAIGSGLSRFAVNRLTPIMEKQNRMARLADVPDESQLTPAGRREFSRELNKDEASRIVNQWADELFGDSPAANEPTPPSQTELADAIASQVERTGPKQPAMGAASAEQFAYYGNSIEGTGKRATDFEASMIDDSRPSMAKLGALPTRWGINAALSNSESQLMRRFGNAIAFDNLTKENGRLYYAGDAWATSGANAETAALFRSIEADYLDYAKAGGTLTREQYSDEVSRLIRRGVPDKGVPKQMVDSAIRTLGVENDLVALMARHGVKGADDVRPNNSHVSRRWLTDRIDAAVKTHGYESVLRLLSQAIAKENDWASAKQVTAMADAIIRNGGRGGRHVSALDFLSGRFDEIARDLEMSGVDKGIADDIVRSLEARFKARDDADKPISLRHRIPLDETYSIETPTGVLSVEDLLDNNLHRLMKSYIRRAYGNAAGSEVLRVLSPDPKNVLTFDGFLDRVRDEAKVKGLDRQRIEGDIAKAEAAWRHTLGFPHDDEIGLSRFWKSIGILRSGLSASMLGSWYSGLTNAIEPVAALATPASILRVSPAVGEIWKIARDGKPSAALLRDFEFITGRGVDWVTHSDPVYVPTGTNSKADQFLGFAQKVAKFAQRTSSQVSLMEPGNAWGYRLIGFNTMQKWAEWSISGKRPSKAFINEFGFANNEGTLDAILKEIRTNVETVKGDATGVRMYDLHTENWSDTRAISAFRAAVYAETTTRFVNPLPNQLPRWMSSEFGKMLIQFRTFSVASWDAKTLQALKNPNLEHLGIFMRGAAMSSALYALRVYVMSLGREDAEQYREEMLTPDRLARIGFARASYSSLIPAAADLTLSRAMGEPPFSFNRGAGMRGELVSIPLADWIGGSFDAVGSAIRHGYDPDHQFSIQDLNNLRRSVPFIPWVEPLVKGIDAIGRAAGLPEKSSE